MCHTTSDTSSNDVALTISWPCPRLAMRPVHHQGIPFRINRLFPGAQSEDYGNISSCFDHDQVIDFVLFQLGDDACCCRQPTSCWSIALSPKEIVSRWRFQYRPKEGEDWCRIGITLLVCLVHPSLYSIAFQLDQSWGWCAVNIHSIARCIVFGLS